MATASVITALIMIYNRELLFRTVSRMKAASTHSSTAAAHIAAAQQHHSTQHCSASRLKALLIGQLAASGPELIQEIARGLLRGVCAMHRSGILHRYKLLRVDLSFPMRSLLFPMRSLLFPVR